MVKVGLDTSFFIALYRKNKKAKEVWTKLIEGVYSGVVLMFSIFELSWHSL